MAKNGVVLCGFGRMGKAVFAAIEQSKDFVLKGVLTDDMSDEMGRTVGDILNRPDYQDIYLMPGMGETHRGSHVIIDFSRPEGTRRAIQNAREFNLPLVCCTTGLDDGVRSELHDLSNNVPVLYASNTSIGVNALLALVQKAAEVLPNTAEVEIVEKHHIGKIDSPSGTALSLARSVAEARRVSHASIVTGRPQGMEKRKDGEITVHALRLGEIPGEHEVHFAFGKEELSLKHRAGDRSIFADGALEAARFLLTRLPGFYSMQDMFTQKK